MADEPTPDAPDNTPDAPPDPEPQDGPGDEMSVDDLRAALAAARKDAAKHRTKAKELEPLAAKARELEDAGKSEQEKLTQRLTDAETRATKAEAQLMRLEVAAVKGLTPAQAKRLVGDTREELEADADDLLASFTAPTQEVDPTSRPKERLRPGSVPDAEPIEMDPRKLAERVRRQ